MNKNDEQAMAFELRELIADDMFPMFQIISKVGIKELKSCFESETAKKSLAKLASGKQDNEAIAAVGVGIAIEIAGIIVSRIGSAKEDIYAFLASLSGMTRDEIASLPMTTFFEMIVAVIRKEEFRDFFQGVVKLFK